MPSISGVPAPNEYERPYAGYVSLVPEADIVSALDAQLGEMAALVAGVTAEKERFRYGAGKWSVRQVIGHLIDGERVFGYRALCFSRDESAQLPGFDENLFVAKSHYDEIPLAELVEEMGLLRRANVAMLGRLEPDDWDRRGVASGYPITLRALAYVMAGHPRHHMKVLAERYLKT
jgi:hypothetical protein